MTEEEWLKCEEPGSMLASIGVTGSGRKLRLFAVACCRGIQYAFPGQDQIDRRLGVAERCADGLATQQELRKVHRFTLDGGGDVFDLFGNETVCDEPHWAAMMAIARCERAAIIGVLNSWPPLPPLPGFFGRLRQRFVRPPRQTWWPETSREYRAEQLRHCNLFREIFGNPFRPVAFNSAWSIDTAVSLARQMYESRDFSAMPILADALQDAGCENDDVLSHCRDPQQTHVRGCWVVDLVLEKS